MEIKALELREIDLRKNKKLQISTHDDLVAGKHYLGKVSGELYVLRPMKVWFGWNMQGWVNPVGIQLDAVDRLWEIMNPEVVGMRKRK